MNTQLVLRPLPLDFIFGSAVLFLASAYIYRRYFKRGEYDDLLIDIGSIPPKKQSDVQPIKTISINNFVEQMHSHGKNVAIFYGSQTGTAEGLAKRFAHHLSRFSDIRSVIFDPEYCQLECFPQFSQLNNAFIVFFIATYGEGDPTDNAVDFINWLKTDRPNLAGTRFMLFGLGNSTYTHYNATAKIVDKLMTKYGASRMHPIGLGDDDKNLELDYITWRDSVTEILTSQYGFTQSETMNEKFTPSFSIQVIQKPDNIFSGEPSLSGSYCQQTPPFNAQNPYLAEIKLKEELYKNEARSCLNIKISLSGSELKYETGDHLGLIPANDQSRVCDLAKILNFDLDEIIELKAIDPLNAHRTPFPCPCSYRTAFTHYLDIRSCPSVDFFTALLQFTSDAADQLLLKSLSSDTAAGIQHRNEWVRDAGRDIVEVLESVPSCRPPVALLCELLPRLQIRYYSISSAPELSKGQCVEITAAIADFTNLEGRRVKGVATGMLAASKIGQKLPIFIRPSSFHLPSNPLTPLVLIGPGTGFAPFRGFLQHRSHLQNQGNKVGPCMLFFGCRNASVDFMYEYEMAEYRKNGVISRLILAFSRDPVEPEDTKWSDPKTGKMYVQHRIKQHADEVWNLIHKSEGHIYICGDAKNMAKDVHNTLIQIAIEQEDFTQAQARSYFNDLEKSGRFLSDVWS